MENPGAREPEARRLVPKQYFINFLLDFTKIWNESFVEMFEIY